MVTRSQIHNRRRDRRRQETRDQREVLQVRKAYEQLGTDPCIIIFSHWRGECIEGYIYNDSRFANGSFVCTSKIQFNDTRFMKHKLWTVRSEHTLYRVHYLTERWIAIGASSPLNRLKYKLWPKLVMIALLFRVRRVQCQPGGTVYVECMQRFEKMKLYP